MDKITPPNPETTAALLSELFSDVQKWESPRDGGQKLTVGAETINKLRQTQINFGNPKDKLILLTESMFKDIGLDLNPIYQRQMQGQYHFYYLTLNLDLRPQPGAQFKLIGCELDFSPKGEDEPIIVTIFPQSKWRTVINWGTSMDLGLNENLDWNIGVDTAQLSEIVSLPGNVTANVHSKNDLKAFLVVPEYNHEVGRFEITAQGEARSTCYWYIQEPDLLKLGTVQFAIVFKVPQHIPTINLQGIAWAEPNMNWLTANLRDVFSALSDNLQNLLKRKDQAAHQLATVTSESWQLKLPQS